MLIDTVNAAVAEHAVIVLRDQGINDEEQVRFSRAFGPLELPPQINLRGSIRRRRLGPELYDVSNLDEQGDFLPAASLQLASNRANEEFHTDSSFNALPTKWSLLSARILPPFGADTQFVDTRAVYDALPKDLREKAQGAVAEHYFWKTRSRAGFGEITDDMRRAMPPVTHPVVRVIPESGRPALYIGNHATHIVGWPRMEGERFLDELNGFAAQPAIHLHASLVCGRFRDLGQPLHHPPRHTVRHFQIQARLAAHNDQRVRPRNVLDGGTTVLADLVPNRGRAVAASGAGSPGSLAHLDDSAVSIDPDPIAGLDHIERIAIEIGDGTGFS